MGSCRARSVYLTTHLLGRLSPLSGNQYRAQSFARNWQLLFLNQRKGENDRRNISCSISTKECYRPRRGLNPRPPGLQSDGTSNRATEADFLGALYGSRVNSACNQLGPRVNSACFVGYTNTLSQHTYFSIIHLLIYTLWLNCCLFVFRMLFITKFIFCYPRIALISDRSNWALISNKWRYLHILICFLCNYIVSFSGYQTLLKDPVNKSEYSNGKKNYFTHSTQTMLPVFASITRDCMLTPSDKHLQQWFFYLRIPSPVLTFFALGLTF